MEELVPLLVLVAYAVLSLLGRFARKRGGEDVQDVHEPAEPSTVDRMLRDMMRQAGVEPEPQVPSEHRPTPGEHRPTVSEHRQAASETYVTVSEHRQTATETRPTPSEHALRATEHLPTPGEHLKGDLPVLPIAKVRPHKRKRRRSPFVNAISADLTGGAEALGRAMVLCEILGPPLSLRPPDGRV